MKRDSLRAGTVTTISSVAGRVARGEVTSRKLTEQCLTAIEALNPTLNAFITVTADEALAQADHADKEIAAGRRIGPLHGIPISLKDLIDQKGVRTSAGSLVRKDHLAAHDAVVTRRLRAAGAVFVGKTNLHEFAFGTTSEDSGFGPVRNPHDSSRSPGGSSGGSAAAVASGMSLGTVGTDTGGSIRIPAAACGVVGLKPEWGHVSASGVVPLSRQLDHVGPLAASVADAWLIYNAMQPESEQIGDNLDATPLKGLRLGRLTGYFFDRLDADVEHGVLDTIARLQQKGARVVDVTVPHANDIAAIYLHLVFGDAAEYHARTLVSRPQDYTAPVRLRLEMARYVLAEDYIRRGLHPRAARQGAHRARDRSRPGRRRCAGAAGAGDSRASTRRGHDAGQGRARHGAHAHAAMLAALQPVRSSRHLDSMRPHRR
jgi:aspartyl-tRNA(Asn)/glutamyl-tRNA(Gln) amidotransferase subunit A